MAAVWPQLSSAAVSSGPKCTCKYSSSSKKCVAPPKNVSLDASGREIRSSSIPRAKFVSTNSSRIVFGIQVTGKKFGRLDYSAKRRRRLCGCEVVDGARASSHLNLNFQLPSRNFAGCDRGSASTSFEPSELGCKSASYNNPQFGAERGGKQQHHETDSKTSLGFYLHDLMDQAGIETTHARVARMGFVEEGAKLRNGDSASDNKASDAVDVARAALEISAEDDALVSHSSVPLPVDSYLDRLDSMATEFAGHHLPAHSPDVFESLGSYLWSYKGFRCTKARTSQDARDFYLNGVLTRRQGPPLMLGLIYSEVVKRLWRSGTIDFLVDMDIPVDGLSFPLPIYKKPYGTSVRSVDDPEDNTELFNPKNVLSEILRSLKKLYWPWRSLPGAGEGSDFLEAATAASRGIVTSASDSHGPFESLFNAPSSERGSEVARARAAQYRLQRGIWTSTTFGDLRRALAASERLVILGDEYEHRDYGMLLFHAGLYEQSFQYLNSYANREVPTPVPVVFNALKAQVEAKEAVALNRLLERLSLIMTERSWNISSDPPPPIVSPPDPW
ncbi:unnamed protein product [Calypogeia fissa]